MKSSAVRALLLCGVVYLVAGLVFGELAGRAATIDGRNAWRWAAWAVSAMAFGLHIVYEQVRIGSSAKLTALRVALAVSIGAFGLAAAANIHALRLSPPKHSTMMMLSLVIWPIMTALPAFVVALIAAVIVARVRRSMQS